MRFLCFTLFLSLVSAICPSLTPFEPNDITHGFVDMSCTNCVATAHRFDLNCHGLNQTFPDGSYIDGTNNKDNAQLVIYKGKCLQLSLWCGYQDAAMTIPMQNTTLINVYSIAKILFSQGLTMMIERGPAQWKDRVSDHWPAFAQNGKSDITIEQVAANFAGIPITGHLNFEDIILDGDYSVLKATIEGTTPTYGSSQKPRDGVYGYSPVVWSWILFFLSEYIDPLGRNMIDFVNQEITNKTGSEVHWGISINDTISNARAAEIRAGVFPPTPCDEYITLNANLANNCSIPYRAIYNPIELQNPFLVNTLQGRNIFVPAGIVFSTAKAIADTMLPFTLGSMSPILLIDDEALGKAIKTLSNTTDANAFYPTSFGRAGYWKNAKSLLFGPYPKTTWGHTGAAGSVAFNSIHQRVTFSYMTTNYGGATCQHQLPFNSWSLINTYWGWPVPDY